MFIKTNDESYYKVTTHNGRDERDYTSGQRKREIVRFERPSEV